MDVRLDSCPQSISLGLDPAYENYKFGEELAEQKQLATFAVRSYPVVVAVRHQGVIDSAVDGVGFFRGYDRDDKGWPLVMAAACAVVDQAGGMIVTNGYGWFCPLGNEVKCVLEP